MSSSVVAFELKTTDGTAISVNDTRPDAQCIYIELPFVDPKGRNLTATIGNTTYGKDMFIFTCRNANMSLL